MMQKLVVLGTWHCLTDQLLHAARVQQCFRTGEEGAAMAAVWIGASSISQQLSVHCWQVLEEAGMTGVLQEAREALAALLGQG
jgi:hypothetical protein